LELINKLLRQLNFTIQEAATNFIRSGWMSGIVVTTMVASLSIFGIFWLMFNDFNYITKTIGSKIEIMVFLNKDGNTDDIAKTISKMEEVSKVTIIKKEQAWEDMKQDLKANMDLNNIGKENPLPDSLQVTVKNSKDVEYVSAKMKEIPKIDEIKYSKELVEYLNKFKKLISLIGIMITIILGSATLAIIVNTIRLAVNSRKTEIEIMRLVGATDWFIRLPFLLEGIFFGFSSAVFTSIILVIWRSFSVTQIQKILPFVPILDDSSVIKNLLIYTFIISIIIGLLGSSISVHHYLGKDDNKLGA